MIMNNTARDFVSRVTSGKLKSALRKLDDNERGAPEVYCDVTTKLMVKR